VLRWMPVAQNAETGQAPEVGHSPIKTVLRSKGFMWMTHNHMTAFYWSHAGQHFEIRDEGDWCALTFLSCCAHVQPVHLCFTVHCLPRSFPPYFVLILLYAT
jgi:hypothetical protein